jgi:hypothetical protein
VRASITFPFLAMLTSYFPPSLQQTWRWGSSPLSFPPSLLPSLLPSLPPSETAKIFNYISRARPWAQAVTDLLFVCFALTFFVTRLVGREGGREGGRGVDAVEGDTLRGGSVRRGR